MASTSAERAPKPAAAQPIRGLPSWQWPLLSLFTRTALLCFLLIVLSGIALRLSGYVGGAYSWFLLSSAGDNSWFPMDLAYDRVTGQTPGTLHELFFVEKIKFQYPASSLLLYSALDFIGLPPTPNVLNVCVWLSILLTSFAVFRICQTFIGKQQMSLRFAEIDKYVVSAVFALATLFFYPIMISWRLGQIQGILNMLFAFACLCWLGDRKLAAGVLIGLVCLVKPQFSLFLLWGALRRQHAFVLGQAAVIAIGTALSIVLYGWHNVAFYTEVLSYISRHGEVFWDNTSVNGFVSGLIQPHETLIWRYHEFPPYHPVTYVLTLVSSAVIVGAALFWRPQASPSPSSLDFMMAAFCFTLASPVAWGHHFGIAMPIFAVAFLEIARLGSRPRAVYLMCGWIICFALFSVNWNFTQQFSNTALAPLQYWRLYAAFGFIFILYTLRAGPAPPSPAPSLHGGIR